MKVRIKFLWISMGLILIGGIGFYMGKNSNEGSHQNLNRKIPRLSDRTKAIQRR